MYLSTFDRYPSKQTKVKSFKFQQGREWLSELEKGGGEEEEKINVVKAPTVV